MLLLEQASCLLLVALKIALLCLYISYCFKDLIICWLVPQPWLLQFCRFILTLLVCFNLCLFGCNIRWELSSKHKLLSALLGHDHTSLFVLFSWLKRWAYDFHFFLFPRIHWRSIVWLWPLLLWSYQRNHTKTTSLFDWDIWLGRIELLDIFIKYHGVIVHVYMIQSYWSHKIAFFLFFLLYLFFNFLLYLLFHLLLWMPRINWQVHLYLFKLIRLLRRFALGARALFLDREFRELLILWSLFNLVETFPVLKFLSILFILDACMYIRDLI